MARYLPIIIKNPNPHEQSPSDHFMAIGSLHKKKHSKRSNLKARVAMASRPNPSSNHKKSYLVVSVLLVISAVVLLGISSSLWSKFKSHDKSFPRIYTIEVVNEFPHDPHAFTQGLLYAGNNTIFESTGLYGESSVRKVALQSGKVEALHKMDDSYFGEGLTLLGERLFQVTWLENTGFIYDRNNLSKVCAPPLFLILRNLLIKCKMVGVWQLMERSCLEVMGLQHCILSTLNHLKTDCIARVSPEDGTVLGWILLQTLRGKLVAAGNHGIDVLNGIAWDSEEKRIFVTGKLWPKLYEIQLDPAKKQYTSGYIEQFCLRKPVHFAKP
ncbi:glutaminyl-peptide cyclotransferase isoform X2 [Corylus avellana]|uniref:glutaminyl-peptide cyclotransferase isoform X2 n=1 Tax=Corylus avellana TaxID=13451 RepID=UPI00286AC255|nr:glutaminyl-peptide cyclotransferase isoform X2 [Corylus avellana]